MTEKLTHERADSAAMRLTELKSELSQINAQIDSNRAEWLSEAVEDGQSEPAAVKAPGNLTERLVNRHNTTLTEAGATFVGVLDTLIFETNVSHDDLRMFYQYCRRESFGGKPDCSPVNFFQEHPAATRRLMDYVLQIDSDGN